MWCYMLHPGHDRRLGDTCGIFSGNFFSRDTPPVRWTASRRQIAAYLCPNDVIGSCVQETRVRTNRPNTLSMYDVIYYIFGKCIRSEQTN